MRQTTSLKLDQTAKPPNRQTAKPPNRQTRGLSDFCTTWAYAWWSGQSFFESSKAKSEITFWDKNTKFGSTKIKRKNPRF